MNILVCIKQVPESNKVDVDPVTGVLKRDGADSKMNPYDLYALEAALRMKEKLGASVTVITMGPNQAAEIIREAYSMGADNGIIISDRKFAGADVLATAYTLTQGARKAGNFDVIICGKQTTDGDTAQVGPEMSEYLNIPSIANIIEIVDVNEKDVTVKMDMADTVEIAKIKYPCLLCVDKDIYVPRLPSYVRKKATESKPIEVITFNDLDDRDENKYGLNGSPTQVRRIFPPEVNDEREMWSADSEELAERMTAKLCEFKFTSGSHHQLNSAAAVLLPWA